MRTPHTSATSSHFDIDVRSPYIQIYLFCIYQLKTLLTICGYGIYIRRACAPCVINPLSSQCLTTAYTLDSYENILYSPTLISAAVCGKDGIKKLIATFHLDYLQRLSILFQHPYPCNNREFLYRRLLYPSLRGSRFRSHSQCYDESQRVELTFAYAHIQTDTAIADGSTCKHEPPQYIHSREIAPKKSHSLPSLIARR